MNVSAPEGTAWNLARRGLTVVGCILLVTSCTDKAGAPAGQSAASGSDDQIRAFCSACHAFAPPDVLPRASWRGSIEKMYKMYEERVVMTSVAPPPLESVVEYFVSRAPERLPTVASTANQAPGPVVFRPRPRKIAGLPPYPGVSSVKMVHLFDDRHVELLLCEMRFSQIFLIQPSVSMNRVLRLGRVSHPSRAEIVDLDGDGVRDVLVASLGTVTPSDSRNGGVVWLRGRPNRKFQTIPLAEGLGRVADAEVNLQFVRIKR